MMNLSIQTAVRSNLFQMAFALCASVASFIASPVAADKATLRVLVSYDHGSFLENLEVQADGRVLYTDYLQKKIEVMTADESAGTFAEVDIFPISLISIDDGYLVAGHAKSFFAGEDFVMTQTFLTLDKDGNQTARFAAPGARMLNGMVKLSDGTILVADSLTSSIWQVDVAARTLSPWLQDQALAMVPNDAGFLPGANGLKLGADGLIVSNTSQGSLALIRLDAQNNPVGQPEKIVDAGRIDDFWVREDGSILYTTHSDELMIAGADGTVSEIFAHGCNGCTAIAPYPLGQDKDFVFVNDGGMFEGHKDPATVVLITLED